MGRPIKKSWFGKAATLGNQILVNGVKFADGTTSTDAYIIKQTGSTAYLVQDTAMAHAPEIVFLANASSVTDLMPGQCFILAVPFGGSARPCKKISQFRVSVHNADGSVGNYTWSTIPAVAAGQADLTTADIVGGPVMSVSLLTGGFGYFTAPTVTISGDGVGATATATVANGSVTGLVLGAGGSGYTSATVAIAAPTALIDATATATETGGVIDSISLVNGGGYYTSAPAVTVTGATAGSGADITAIVTNGAVTGFTIVSGGTGYDAPVSVSIAAPTGTASTATGSASV